VYRGLFSHKYGASKDFILMFLKEVIYIIRNAVKH